MLRLNLKMISPGVRLGMVCAMKRTVTYDPTGQRSDDDGLLVLQEYQGRFAGNWAEGDGEVWISHTSPSPNFFPTLSHVTFRNPSDQILPGIRGP